MVLKLENSN